MPYGFTPTKWWRAEDKNGEILAETSDPKDNVFKELLQRDDVTISRMHLKTTRKWVEERP